MFLLLLVMMLRGLQQGRLGLRERVSEITEGMRCGSLHSSPGLT